MRQFGVVLVVTGALVLLAYLLWQWAERVGRPAEGSRPDQDPVDVPEWLKEDQAARRPGRGRLPRGRRLWDRSRSRSG